MKGSLEEFNPGELVQVLGILARSGVLHLQTAGCQGLIAFRNGRVIYAASPSVRESLGSLLMSRRVIDESQLTAALSKQAAGREKTRLGSILVQEGVIEQETLEDVIREQFSAVISELVGWNTGTFDFESKDLADRGEVELEAADFIAPSGVEPTHVLLDAARRADEKTLQEEPAADPRATIDELVEQSNWPTIHGEVVYRLLDLGMSTCERCVLFAVHSERFQVLGHVGFEKVLADLVGRLATLDVARDKLSILSRAVEQRHMVLARLEADGEDGKIQDVLGEPSESKSLAIPLSFGDQVIMVLYGDCLPPDLGTGRLDELEVAAVELLRQVSASTA